MKKHSIFKKILSVVLSLAMVFSVVAISAPHAHAATSSYYYKDTVRTGLKTIETDDILYYDLNADTLGATEPYIVDSSEFKFYKNALMTRYDGVSPIMLWSNIATLIFKSMGSGYGYGSTYKKDFDALYTEDTSDLTCDIDLYNELASWDEEGTHMHGDAQTLGWTLATNRKVPFEKLVEDSVLAENKDQLLENLGEDSSFSVFADQEDTVLYNLVKTGGSWDNDGMFLSSFGIMFYDFQLVPLADRGVEYITAAEPYGSLQDANAADAPGVSYRTAGTGNTNTTMVTNPSATESVVSTTYSETSSSSVSNSFERTESFSFGTSSTVSTEFSVSFPLVDTSVTSSFSLGMTTEEAVQTAYGETKELTNSITNETTAEVVLPAHTQIGITQQAGETEIKFEYDCPVTLTYKVAVFQVNYRWGLITDIGAYSIGMMCTTFGTSSTTGGLDAIENLYNRAIVNADEPGFESSYGNVYAYYNDDKDYETDTIDWNSIVTGSAAGAYGKVGYKGKDMIEMLNKNRPMSSTGGVMSINAKSQNTDISSILPLYDLDYIQISGDGVYTVAPGGEIDFNKIQTMGYNRYSVPYYGYVSDVGEWVLCDADGNELSGVDGAEMQTVGNYQKLKVSELGTYYAKYKIDEELYPKVNQTADSEFITNGDLSSTAVVTINATETGLDHICSAGPWQTTLAATCKAEGEQTSSCTVCQRVMYTQTIAKREHTPVSATTPATCTQEGNVTTTCGECRALISSVTTPKLAHTPGAWVTTTDAACETHGEKQQSCTECQTVLAVESIDAHGHAAYWITVKEATCSAAGREEYVCSICKSVLETREIAKLEHIPGKWEITKDSSCTQSGLMQQTCALCNALLGEPKVIDPHEHQLGSWQTVLEPGCETEGEKIRACTVCNGTIETEAIPALGHTEGVWVTSLEATCETAGEQHKSCTRCGVLIETKRLDALGHTPGPEMTCVTDQVCLVCEEVLVPADGRSHTWTEWSTYKAASFFTEEQQWRECSSCYLAEYRFVKGTSGCHKYFPHCDGSGENCWACETLSNSNGFFRNLGKFLTWFFFENIITNIFFPHSHEHFHEYINTDEIFGS